MDISGPPPQLSAFLQAFDQLSKENQARAIQLISQKTENKTITEVLPSASALSSLDVGVHSCSVCKRFAFTPSVRYLHKTETTIFEAGSLSFTKEALIQGLSRQCLLVRWVVTHLRRHLEDFKSDLARKGITKTNETVYENLMAVANDLKYISTEKGVAVRFELSREANSGFLQLAYEPEPSLLDKLWEVSQNLHGPMKYRDLERKYNWGAGARFNIYTTDDDPAAADIPHRPAKRYLDSQISVDLAVKWIADCLERHEHCSKRVGILPSKVIDCRARNVKLYWTEEGETGQYVALSYCWGGPQPVMTTQQTAQEFTDGFPKSKLPKTIVDAIAITSALGFRYLWVDCLCIIQDDPDDVAREISNMARIFQEAHITISAANATSVHHGFLSREQIAPEPSVRLPFQTLCSGNGSIVLEQPVSYSQDQDPIHLRAWTLQEHILARRMLVYSTRGLWWTCETTFFYEDMGAHSVENALSFRYANAVNEGTLEYWRSILRDYSRRFMTFAHDKLPGIAGVAANYSCIFESEYLAGLWEFALVTELMWSPSRSDITRPFVQRAPSWSWASVDGEINHNWCPQDVSRDGIKIVSSRVTPVSTSSPFGCVDPSRSLLVVEGDLAQVYWREDRRCIYCLDPTHGHQGNRGVDVGRAHADASETIPKNGDHLEVWAIVVTHSPPRGLLLVHGETTTFRRVGIFSRIWDEKLCDFRRQVISIV